MPPDFNLRILATQKEVIAVNGSGYHIAAGIDGLILASQVIFWCREGIAGEFLFVDVIACDITCCQLSAAYEQLSLDT